MRRTILGAALIAVAAFLPSLASAQQPGITRTDLSRSDLSVAGREVLQVLVEFGPGVEAANHSHPGEELVYVTAGALEYHLDGRAPVVLKAGEVLFIPTGVAHSVKNVSSGRSAELATYIVEKAKPLVTLVD